MGKGSTRRPTNEEAYTSNYEAIFGKKTKEDLLGTWCPECKEGMMEEAIYTTHEIVYCDSCGYEQNRYV
jgi:hypothetical protein